MRLGALRRREGAREVLARRRGSRHRSHLGSTRRFAGASDDVSIPPRASSVPDADLLLEGVELVVDLGAAGLAVGRLRPAAVLELGEFRLELWPQARHRPTCITPPRSPLWAATSAAASSIGSSIRLNSAKAPPPEPLAPRASTPPPARACRTCAASAPLRAATSCCFASMRSSSAFMLSTAERCSARRASARSRSPTTRFFWTSASRASFSSLALSASSARRSHLSDSASRSSTFFREDLLGLEPFDELFARGLDLVLHLLDNEVEVLSRVVGFVEQRVDVARDDLAHAVEDPHAASVHRREPPVKRTARGAGAGRWSKIRRIRPNAPGSRRGL